MGHLPVRLAVAILAGNKGRFDSRSFSERDGASIPEALEAAEGGGEGGLWGGEHGVDEHGLIGGVVRGQHEARRAQQLQASRHRRHFDVERLKQHVYMCVRSG